MDAISKTSTGEDMFAFNALNGPGWHLKGQSLKGLASSEEMMKASHLDYKVKTVPAEFGGVILKDYRWVINADTNKVYASVKGQYEVLQNEWLFLFLDAVIEKGEAVYETAGALLDGAVVFACASLPRKYYICDDDELRPFVVTANSHNKLLTYSAFTSIIRPVCWNTLNAAMSEAKDAVGAGIVKIPHRGGAQQAIKAAPSALNIAIRDIEKLAPVYRDLANKRMTVHEFNDFVNIMMPSSRDEQGKPPTRLVMALREYLYMAWDSPLNSLHDKNRHTGWTAMNALTQFVDHYEPEKKSKKGSVSPDFRAWFGTGPKMRAKALRVLSKMLLSKSSIEDERYEDGLATALETDLVELRQRPEAQLLNWLPDGKDEDGNVIEVDTNFDEDEE